MRELNSLDSRRGRKSLDVNNVIYWFKNTRAAVKRAEQKARQLQSDAMRFPQGMAALADTLHAHGFQLGI